MSAVIISTAVLRGRAVRLHVAELVFLVCKTAGIPVTSCREIRVLQACRHPNIVHLKKVVTGSKPDRQEANILSMLHQQIEPVVLRSVCHLHIAHLPAVNYAMHARLAEASGGI